MADDSGSAWSMPPRGPVESALGLPSLVVWGAAILLRVLVVSGLPGWDHRVRLPDEGCVIHSSLMALVNCRGTAADALFGQVLTFAFWWTDGVGWMAAFAPWFFVPWLLSIGFALRFLTSRFRAA
jgi:hypothetical protein